MTAAVPPAAARRPRVLVQHGVTRTDDYAWLADVNAGDVLAYLSAERGHYEEATAALEPRRQALVAELRGHVPPEDASVPWRHGAVEYRTCIRADDDHERILRLDAHGAEHLVLDGATVAGGGPHLTYGVLLPTRDGARLAYSVDLVGEELYELRFRDLATGEDLPDRIPGVLAGGAWSADGCRFFYLLPDAAFRPHQVVCHELGTSVDDDFLVHAEPDPGWELSVRESRDGGWIVLDSRGGDSSETWLVNARYPDDTPRLVAERRPGVEYTVEVLGGGWDGQGPDRLLLVTNDRVPQFRLAETAIPGGPSGADGDSSTWNGVDRGVTAPDERLEWAAACAGHVVLGLRRDCEPFLRVLDRVPGGDGVRGVREVHPGVPAGSLRLWHPDDVAGEFVVVVEENLVTAPVWVRIDLATGSRQVLRRSQPPGIDPTRYVTERLLVSSSGGSAGAGDGRAPPRPRGARRLRLPDHRLRRAGAAVLAGFLAARPRAPRPGGRVRGRARARRRGARTAVVGAGPARGKGPQRGGPGRRPRSAGGGRVGRRRGRRAARAGRGRAARGPVVLAPPRPLARSRRRVAARRPAHHAV